MIIKQQSILQTPNLLLRIYSMVATPSLRLKIQAINAFMNDINEETMPANSSMLVEEKRNKGRIGLLAHYG